ncbi:MAG TPA: chemotaxis protein CheA [Acidobacteriaceae bacterium]|nr:chemotaxis protein CheA [Acidobacteriaceae bacterium]
MVASLPGNQRLKFSASLSDNESVDELTREFLLESQEGLDRMERGLTELETRPGDAELLAEIFRSVHTIKGTTGFLGFGRLEALSHAGENLLGLLREGRLAATPDIVSGLLALMDRLRGILRSIEASGGEGESRRDDAAMIARLEVLQALEAPADAPADVSEPAMSAASAVPPNPVAGRTRRTAGKMPARPAAGNRQKPPRFQPRSPLPITAAEAGPSTAIAAPPCAREESDVCSASPAAAGASAPARPGNPPTPPAAETQPAAAVNTADSTLRVDVELLNRMMNLVGELVLTRNQILQATSADAGFSLLGRRLDMVTADLREAVMKARMQPVSHVFSRFPRLVRDLARGLSKQVRLELEGQETELDKSLLEAIRDPLTHAIRNAIDHGIEAPAVRRAAGKPAEGLLRLRAYHEGSHVVVEVHDDGAGMNLARIREKAVEQQLVPAQRAEQMSEREILQLIFLPGFSTAAAVTSVSGRGVGMDVVRTNVEKIGGKVDVDSRAGHGTQLRLRIPLTLAIIPALIVRSRGQNFAVPQSALMELVHLSDGESDSRMEWLENSALCRLRGRLLPLIFLDRLLQQPARDRNSPCDIAVLNADGRRYGLVVDGLADPEEIVVKPLAAVLREIGFYAGATILGNGEMALILNPGAIAQHAGVSLTSDAEEAGLAQKHVGLDDYLVVEAGGRRAALPLETVVRIERIPRSRIEMAGPHPVLRLEGALLPLDDAAAAAGAGDPEARTTVVVCRDAHRQIGMTVSQVLDVTGGRQLEEAGTGAVAAGVTLLHEQVTGIASLAGIPALETEAAR